VSLAHDGYAFQSPLHGPLRCGAAEIPILRQQNVGLQGEAHLIGAVQGRDLDCDGFLSGYVSAATLQAALDDLTNRAGTLTGTLTTVILGVTTTYTRCTYEGCDLLGDVFRDGAGNLGWCARIRLRWRQRAS
jgi:hypothetical protein